MARGVREGRDRPAPHSYADVADAVRDAGLSNARLEPALDIGLRDGRVLTHEYGVDRPRRAAVFEQALSGVRDAEADAAEQRALEQLPRLLGDLEDAAWETRLFGPDGRPARGAFASAVLYRLGDLVQRIGTPTPPRMPSHATRAALRERGYQATHTEIAPFLRFVFEVHRRLPGLPATDRLPFGRGVIRGFLGQERWNTRLYDAVMARRWPPVTWTRTRASCCAGKAPPSTSGRPVN